MIQAGIYDPRAVAYFFLARTALAIGLAALAFLFVPAEQGGPVFWLLVGLGGIVGYLGPSLYIDRRIKTRKATSIRPAFRISWTCWWCAPTPGSSMEASLDRVGRELGDSYPSLTANIHMTNLEIRAGRTMSDALEHLGDRLGLDEARSFATLIQQSAELGSSITDALRVYSATTCATSGCRAPRRRPTACRPSSSVPMMICIFPVLFVVILLPVFVRLHVGNY